jgi:hypothetical protein
MKMSKLLPVLLCFCTFFLKANNLPLPVVKHDFEIDKPVMCQLQIRIKHFGNANINVVVSGQTVVNRTYIPFPIYSGNDFATVGVNVGGVATINATNCIVYITSPAGNLYVVDFNPIVNTQLTISPTCEVSDDL